MLNQLKVAQAPGLCQQTAKGSLIALRRRAVLSSARTDCCSHVVLLKWPNLFYSVFACLTLGSMVSAFNETLALQWSTTKRRSQMAKASQRCHRPCLSALMYQSCSEGFRAITNPTGTTIPMAAGSDVLKQKETGRVGWQRHWPPPPRNWF